MSKCFCILQSDYNALPDSAKGIYGGEKFPEFKGANMINLDGRVFVEGKHYRLVTSGKHKTVGVCSQCKKISIIYAKGKCKACAQRLNYREVKPDVPTVKEIQTANKEFRRSWPANLICGLDGVKYTKDSYPYTKADETAILSAMMGMGPDVTDGIIAHYRDGLSYAEIGAKSGTSKQNAHALGQRRMKRLKSLLVSEHLLKRKKQKSKKL